MIYHISKGHALFGLTVMIIGDGCMHIAGWQADWPWLITMLGLGAVISGCCGMAIGLLRDKETRGHQ
jgi:hypothetical protein